MTRTCSSCGATTAAEARFCRHCGAPLKTAATYGADESVSPLAQTVPLSGEGLTTSGLNRDEAGGTAPETKRVGRAEIEHLLRRASLEKAADDSHDGDARPPADNDYAAPPTGELTREQPAPVAAHAAPAQTPARASSGPRSRRAWVWVAGLLLLVAVAGAFLVVYLLRQRAPQEAGNVATPSSNVNQPSNDEQTAEPTNVNPAVEETAASADETPRPAETPPATPRPSASVEPTRETRAQATPTRETVETPAAQATPTPVPTAPPRAQATPTPAPTPAAGNDSGTTATEQARSDAFFFQAVNVVNGRDLRTLQRAELLRALQLFQNVRNGAHTVEANRESARLGRELDRRRKNRILN